MFKLGIDTVLKAHPPLLQDLILHSFYPTSVPWWVGQGNSLNFHLCSRMHLHLHFILNNLIIQPAL